jgi:Na+/alanine symporter
MLRTLHAFFDEVAGTLLTVGHFAFFAIIAYLIWPQTAESLLQYVEIAPSSFFLLLNVVALISSPFLLFSSLVGLWRMQELSGGLRIVGTIIGLVMLAQGLANVALPLYFLTPVLLR